MSTFQPATRSLADTAMAVHHEAERLRTQREARRLVDAEERPPATVPDGLTLRERFAIPRPPVQWRVEGWLPANGRVVFVAQAKAGKTTTTVNLVRSLVDGAAWLGRDRVSPVTGTVVVLDFEMTEHQLDDWYRRMGIERLDNVVVWPMRGQGGAFDLRDDECRRGWVERLRAVNAEVVVWDCLRPVMDSLGLDEHHDAGLLLTAFDTLLADLGQPEAVLVHHMGHGAERARGDSRIVGWGDANWKLVLGEETGEAGPRFISAYGRDVEQHEAQLDMHLETGRLSVVGGTRANAKAVAAYDAVEALLRAADEPVKSGDIETLAMAQGVPRQLVRQALAGMLALQQVTVEVGQRNARLYALSANYAASSPVRRSSPTGRGELASQFAAVRSSGELANWNQNGQEPARPTSSPPPLGELSAEQQAILARATTTTTTEVTS